MRTRYGSTVVGITTLALLMAACSTQETVVTDPDLVTASFARQVNRCEKFSLVGGEGSPDGYFDFQEARNDAASKGGAIASISSAEDQACIAALSNSLNDAGVSLWERNYWLNAADFPTEGEWRWLNTKKNGLFYSKGKSVGYTNWDQEDPSDPLDDEPGGGTGENCLTIELFDVTDSFWHDWNCGSFYISFPKFGYVLKKP